MYLRNAYKVLVVTSVMLFSCSVQNERRAAVVQQVKPDEAAESKPKTEYVYKKTPQVDLKIYLDYPEDWKATDRRPAIVFFGGGGWVKQSPHQFEPEGKYFSSRGMVAARAAYRVKGRQNTTPLECVEDAKSAVRWVRKNAKKLGVDPNRIVASGGSAGGHMAACTALVDDLDANNEDLSVSSKPEATILFNPVVNLEALFNIDSRRARNRFKNPEDAKRISPYHHLKKGIGPMLILFGTEDRLFKPVPEFMDKSKKLGNRVELYIAEGAKHGFFNRSPWLERTMYRVDEFLASLGYVSGKPTVKLPQPDNEKQ